MRTTHRPAGWWVLLAVLVVGLLFFAACDPRPEGQEASADATTLTEQTPVDEPEPREAEAPRGKLTSFAAEQVYMNPDGDVENIQKIYMMPDRGRIEVSPAGEAPAMTMIFRRDRNVHWMLSATTKRYIERPLEEEEWQKAFEQNISNVEEELGTERIKGFMCHKKRIKTTVSMGAIERTSTAIVWISDQLDLPIRVEQEDGSVTELRNIKKGRQSDRLFDVPDDYEKVDNMMLMFEPAM